MPAAPKKLSRIVAALRRAYGSPAPPLSDPFALVLHENVAYLTEDAKREEAGSLPPLRAPVRALHRFRGLRVFSLGDDSDPVASSAGRKEVMAKPDPHLKEIREVTPSANGCEDCLKIGAQWVHLRLCLTCGHVGCCDDSPNRHATKHFKATGHPIIRSFEPGEDWRWCYVDEQEV